MSKPKIAMYWCASCGGCEESILDLAEDLLVLTQRADVVFWPIATDARYRDLEAVADGEIALSLINGAVRDEAQDRMARLLRRKSRLLVAHGSCAHLGGVVGLANFFNPEDLVNRAYREIPTLDEASRRCSHPGTRMAAVEPRLPALRHRVAPLDRIVPVDYYLPGCPPTPDLVKAALIRALDGTLPPPGHVLADQRALCHTCPLLPSKPDKIRIDRFKRLHEVRWDPARCFLDQALICLGPATRGGCGARCIGANMPCRGCFGPLDNATDQGLKSLALLASLIHVGDAEALERLGAEIPDLAGLLYRYGLASSLFKGRPGSAHD